jgi:hypothetical protein
MQNRLDLATMSTLKLNSAFNNQGVAMQEFAIRPMTCEHCASRLSAEAGAIVWTPT